MFVVTVRTDLPRYRARLKKKMEALVRTKDKSSLAGAKYMVMRAKAFAPKKTGETINGIMKHKKGKGMYEVESVVSDKISKDGKTHFMQNLWANQTAPYRSPKMYWNKYKPTVYGDGSHQTTGKPRFFHWATLETQKRFPKIARANVLKALRTTSG